MCLPKAQDILSPHCQRKKKTERIINTKRIQRLRAVWIYCIHLEGSPSSLYSFCIYGDLGFFRLQSGLSISWALQEIGKPLTGISYLCLLVYCRSHSFSLRRPLKYMDFILFISDLKSSEVRRLRPKEKQGMAIFANLWLRPCPLGK